jgi:hypothetical protein
MLENSIYKETLNEFKSLYELKENNNTADYPDIHRLKLPF